MAARLFVFAITAMVLVCLGAAQAALIDVTAPGDPVVGLRNTVAGGANGDQADWPGGEPPANAINGNFAKYLNFGEVKTGQAAGENTGLYVTPFMGSTVVSSLRFATANDNPTRDPMTFTLEGTTGGPLTGSFRKMFEGVATTALGQFLTTFFGQFQNYP